MVKTENEEKVEMKVLVAYFSHSGMNYVDGKIVPLSVGNTETIAKKIAALTDGTLFEIRTEDPYPYDYKECVKVAVNELKANARPALAADIDIAPYDVIVLGYPNWCGTMPMPVKTFLCGADFSQKIILPFCSNEGSGMGVSEKDLAELCPNSVIKSGLSVHGKNSDDASLKKWLEVNI